MRGPGIASFQTTSLNSRGSFGKKVKSLRGVGVLVSFGIAVSLPVTGKVDMFLAMVIDWRILFADFDAGGK